ncbi:molybdopterin-dependent oxidoreductase [Paenibacillus flagellatus]|uniref:Oxidoreductase n=1 Tax=Paenibacillus flagellatus TaxID=2211139 RepID=A0A2V5KBC7_9BACL|nr:molybdopterin-dependent oxidoreductase [Paenibacillus flagellatus]PYI56232.1 oxidoreductase [Paenibacillus flagellatus]
MEQDRKRRNASLGKRLVRLHAWNGWLVLALAATGLLLFIPELRGGLGFVRVTLKQAHIVLGIVSALIVLLYVPAMRRHIRQLRGKPRQQWNLGVVLALLLGWIVSGVVLWQFRRLPPALTNAALWMHDLLTWVGVPYAIFHAVTRSRWLRVKRPAARTADAVAGGEDAGRPAERKPIVPLGERVGRTAGRLREAAYTRRAFLTWSVAGLLVVLVGPKFARWLFSGSGMDRAAPGTPAADANRMVPAPTPLPESAVPIGGGGKGEFRIYTVVRMPEFDSDRWTFALKGLVEKPGQWNWEQFLQMPRTVQVSDFHCVTGWSVYKTTWEGVPLKRLLDEAGVLPRATHVKFYSGDGVYTDSLTLEQASLDDVMVAVLMDGKPIVRDLGGPVRLLVPKMYAYKSVKWLQGIELIDSEHIGYWGRNGYDQHAWVPGMKPKQVSI